MEDKIEAARVSREHKRVATEIEEVFQRSYRGKDAYSKGQFCKDDFVLRTNHALVVLNRNNDILVSFADDTPPSYAAIFALLLDQIDNTNLLICEDYETDEDGSMVCNESNGSSTATIIWDEKEMYYNTLKEKVGRIMLRKTKKLNK